MVVRKWLIVRANGDVRVVTRSPRLAFDEVAFPLKVTIPDVWGKVYRSDDVEVVLPEPPPGHGVEVAGEPEVGEMMAPGSVPVEDA